MNKILFKFNVVVFIAIIIFISLSGFLVISFIYNWNESFDALLSELTRNLGFPIIATFIGGIALLYITGIKNDVSILNNSVNYSEANKSYAKGELYDAFFTWKILAEKGDAKSQYILGVMYYEGKGIPQNDKQAIKWWKKAEKQGYAKAQFNLGVVYDKGQSVAQNYKEAFKWYFKAAEQGDKQAQNSLASMYSNGQGVAQNDKEAVKWFRKSAKQGYPKAQENLVLMYYKGQGVSKNLNKAYMWAFIMKANGYDSSGEFIKIVEEKMTPDNIAKAHRSANQCLESHYKKRSTLL